MEKESREHLKNLAKEKLYQTEILGKLKHAGPTHTLRRGVHQVVTTINKLKIDYHYDNCNDMRTKILWRAHAPKENIQVQTEGESAQR